MDKFLAAVKSHALKVMTDSRNSNLFDHRGNRGLVRENVINGFLRPLLPSCYGLGTGEVFSTNGDASRQIDIVVYDNVFSIAFFREQDVQLFPCETVFGTIEVKSRMTSEELNKGVQNIRSVKRLKREDATCLDFLPMVNLPLGPGLEADRTKRNPYLGYICAYDGMSATQATKQLNGLIGAAEDRQHLPDFVFNLEQEYIVCRGIRQENQVVPSQQGREFDCFFSVGFNKEEVVMMLYLTLNIQLNQTRLKATRLNDYWKSMVQRALTQGSF